MTRNELYEIEGDVIYNEIARIKQEQEEYRKGVEYGIELMFKAVRKHLAKEEEKALAERRENDGTEN